MKRATSRDKANQDAYISGVRVSNNKSKSKLFKKKKDNGILFAIFDGHGPEGHYCAWRAKEHVTSQFVDDMQDDNIWALGALDISEHTSSSLKRAYGSTSSLLELGEAGIDSSHSGTVSMDLSLVLVVHLNVHELTLVAPIDCCFSLRNRGFVAYCPCWRLKMLARPT